MIRCVPGSAVMCTWPVEKSVNTTCVFVPLTNALLRLKGIALWMGLLVTWLMIEGLVATKWDDIQDTRLGKGEVGEA